MNPESDMVYTMRNDPLVRTALTSGLRVLADVLEEHDGSPLPFHGHLAPLTIQFRGEKAREARAAAAARLPCAWQHETWTGPGTGMIYDDLAGELDGLKVRLVIACDAA
jgi:hypothetical protein